MPATDMKIDATVSLLAENPLHIQALTAGLSRQQMHAPVSEGEWSLNDVLAHLRSCADVWGDCIAAIVAEDNPTLRAINPRTWIVRMGYREMELLDSLRAYLDQREKLLALLRSLSPEQWLRAATVTGAGKPLERTVLFYASWLAEHERSHVRHIARVVSSLAR